MDRIYAARQSKPIVAVANATAASAAYWIASATSEFIVTPSGSVGSIGVLGGKLLTRKLYERIGVTHDAIKTAANADMFSELDDYSAHGWQRFQAWLDRVYVDFTAKVADGRGLPLAEVQKIAKGRIWSGEDAKAIGLVDELGGWPVALKLAREAAGLDADADIELRTYPEEKSLFDQLMGDGRDNSEAPVSIQAQIALIEELRPVAAELRALGLGPGNTGALGMPALAVE